MATKTIPEGWNPSERRRFLFWRNVEKRGHNDCWPHRGIPDAKGYRHVIVDGWRTTAHRAAYVLATGHLIEPELNVLHSCDTRNCCNPAHLSAGTQAQNLADMHARGRAGDSRNFGEQHGRAKLTDLDVLTIRIAYSSGAYSQQELADHYGVGQTQIGRIVHGESRRYLGTYPTDRRK